MKFVDSHTGRGLHDSTQHSSERSSQGCSSPAEEDEDAANDEFDDEADEGYSSPVEEDDEAAIGELDDAAVLATETTSGHEQPAQVQQVPGTCQEPPSHDHRAADPQGPAARWEDMSPQAQAELDDQLEEGSRILAAFHQELEPDMLAWRRAWPPMYA